MAHPKSKLQRYDLPIQGPSIPFPIHSALFQIDGIEPVRLIGHNDSGSASFEDVWDNGGTYPIVTTTETLSLVSTDAQDAVGGTGISTVKVFGLDAAGLRQEVTYTLTGLTPVITTETWSFVYNMEGVAVGTNLSNVGVITATNTTSSQIIGVIQANEGRMHSTVYKVPADMYFKPDNIVAGSAKGDSNIFDFMIKKDGEADLIEWRASIFEQAVTLELNHGLIVPPLAVVRIRTKLIVAGGSSAITANVSGFLIASKYYNES